VGFQCPGFDSTFLRKMEKVQRKAAQIVNLRELLTRKHVENCGWLMEGRGN